MTATIEQAIYPHTKAFEGLDLTSLPSIQAVVDGLVHFELSNGWTVSWLDSVFGHETWAWRDSEKRPSSPAVHTDARGACAFLAAAMEWA